MATALDVVAKSIVVAVPPEQAFRTFTEEIATWWPFATHSIHGEAAERVVWGDESGQVVELSREGKQAVWGELLVWEPPHRFAMKWHPGRAPEESTELEVRFSAEGEGTRVDLEHRGFEKRPPEARKSYDTGWDEVLGCYAGGVNR
jgi:uncharacterized protein YndB with AHSA1/START domain